MGCIAVTVTGSALLYGYLWGGLNSTLPTDEGFTHRHFE